MIEKTRGCNKCEKHKTARLCNGQMVCGWCEHWRLECEAREIAAMNTAQRITAIKARERRRRDVGKLSMLVYEIREKFYGD